MSDAVQWQGSTIEVQARLVPRFLWTTASIDVFVGEQCVLRTGGRMKLIGCCSQTFAHSGAEHVAEVSWGGGLLYSFPYQARIDGVVVKEGRVRVQNWAWGLILPLVLIGLLALLMWSLHHHWMLPELESKPNAPELTAYVETPDHL
jgi:hypothetical protein